MLSPISGVDFYIYAPVMENSDLGNIHLRPFSRDGFLKDLETCEGIISNAGFELPSEALQLRKKILLKPIQGQYEQESNAKAIKQLKLGHVLNKLDSNIVRSWLTKPLEAYCSYPDVARQIAEWISKGDLTDIRKLVDSCWNKSYIS